MDRMERHGGRARHLQPMVGLPSRTRPRCLERPASPPCPASLHGPPSPARPGVHRLDADHPDKDGLQLRAISHVLKIFDKEAKERFGPGCKVGVFLDYVSMPQRSRGSAEDDRTPEEKATFDRALKVRRARPPCRPHRPCPPPASPTPPSACPPPLAQRQ